MITVKNTEFVILDVETTGLSSQTGDKIIEIAAMKIKDGQVVSKFHSLVNPGRLIPTEATNVNNITNEMVSDAPTNAVILPQFMAFIGGASVAGHNVKFDLNFICYELALLGRRLPDTTPAVDTLKMARDLLPYLSNHKLAYLARSLGVRVTETHRALADVELTVQVFFRLLEIAQEQNLLDLNKFFAQFSIEKPTFKFAQTNQASLF